jgi:eukaryotic-like serine/threonine-protein kinase
MVGRTIGNYTLVEKLGQGGMGEVYLAEHRRIGRRAAIKFLLPALTRDADVVTRFFNEARATSLIRHPGIVEIYDCDVVEEQAYIVMEYLEGESLAAALRRTGGLAHEPVTIAAIVGQIASALAAAHRKEIIHRDLKPENVFLSVEESSRAPFIVKILDFGIAKLAAPGGGGSNTRTGGLLGTPVYMSPEQCRGVSTIDRRTDVYALGCLMFELATGRHVFVKDASGDLLVAHIIETPPRVSSIRPEIPAWMDELVAKMLSKSPDDRPSSMDEVVAAIEAFLQVGQFEFSSKVLATGALGRIATPRKRSGAPEAFTETPAATPAAAPPRGPVHSPGAVTIPAPKGAPASPLPSGSGPGLLIGGTQILPTGPSHDSTFRRSASELVVDPPIEDLPPKRKRPMLPVAAGGLALVGVAAWFLLQGKPAHRPRTPAVDPQAAVEPPPPVPTAAAAPTPAAAPDDRPAKPAPAKATIRIVSRPAGAQLWLGDESTPRGQTPLDLVVPRDATGLRALLKADGYRDAPVSIDPAHTGPLQVELEKVKVAHHHASGHPPTHEAETAAPKKAPEKKPPDKKPPDKFFGVGD